MPHVQNGLRAATYAVPKPIVAFGLAAGAWVLVYGLAIACMDTLRLIGL